MRDLTEQLKNRIVLPDQLSSFGFTKQHKTYTYNQNILDDAFCVQIHLFADKPFSQVIDLALEEEYILVDIKTSTGEFVGKIKEIYEQILIDFLKQCTQPHAFKSRQSIEIIDYIRNTYQSELEYLWENTPDNAIFRNKTNGKWFAVMMIITEDKLGLQTNNKIEALNIRYQKGQTDEVIDYQHIFPGFHMNKQSWITIRLDSSYDTKNIIHLIDNSYNIISSSASELAPKVYDYLKLIPEGKVVTYQQIAQYLGNKGLARAVGTILRKCNDETLPCFKVLDSNGKLSDIFIRNGVHIQKELLLKEGILVKDGKVDLAIYQWKTE